MPKNAGRSSRTRHHSNLRPKHKHTKDYLKTYWPYMPLVTLLIAITVVISPWQAMSQRDVLAVATSMQTNQLLEATNQQRLTNQKDELTLSPALSKAAEAKAKDMAARNYWSHKTPEDNAPWTFIVKAGYDYQKAGENLAYGFENENQVVAGWMNSPSHRSNMLDGIFSQVGFGFANSENFVGEGPSTIVVAMYARPTNQPITTKTASTTDTGAYAQTQATTDEPKSITHAQTITGGSIPWVPSIIAFVAGMSLMYLIIKHGVSLKRRLINGERFIISHRLLDATLIALIIFAIVLTREAGVIL